jgi:V/A-type H+-transporting ATPase subunit E
MALEDITAKIIARAEEEAQGILDIARRESDELKKKAEKRIEAEMTAAVERAEGAARAAEERIVAAAELDAKKRELAARQEAISKVLDSALEKLTEADEETYMSFLKAKLQEVPSSGEAELIVSEKDRPAVEANLPVLQSAVDQTGRTLKLRLSSDTRELGGGFVLRQGKIEFNASLSSIRRSQEEKLRSMASTLLFVSEASP